MTNVAACTGGFTWALVEYYTCPVRSGHMSVISFCSGIVAGLIGITPGAGFVPIWSALIIGAATAACSLWAVRLKNWLGYDDNVDAVALHGVGGMVGTLLAALFASKEVALLDGSIIPGGACIDGHWIQLAYNLGGALAILAYAFAGTYAIILLMNMVPFFYFNLDGNTGGIFLEEVSVDMSDPYMMEDDEDEIGMPPRPKPSPVVVHEANHFVPRAVEGEQRTGVSTLIQEDAL